MADVNVSDIGVLREFATYLQWLGGTMVEEFSRARSRMAQINENWRDTENARFMEEFSASVEEINKIAGQMDEYSRFVLKKCDILEMYHNG